MKIASYVDAKINEKLVLGMKEDKAQLIKDNFLKIIKVIDMANESMDSTKSLTLKEAVKVGEVDTEMKYQVSWDEYKVDARFAMLFVPSQVKYELCDKYANLKKVADTTTEDFSITPEEFESAQRDFFKLRGQERGTMVTIASLIKPVTLSTVQDNFKPGNGFRWDERSSKWPVELRADVFDPDFMLANISENRWIERVVNLFISVLDSKASAVDVESKPVQKKPQKGVSKPN